MGSIGTHLQEVKRRIALACESAGRSAESVTLLAVSKTFPADAVREALADVRAQLEWHLIGPLQSNKTRAVAEAFDWVHSVDRLKIAERLAEQRPAHLRPLNLCLQVNIRGEASKGGVAPAEVPALARAVAALPSERVRMRGLMSIPEPAADLGAQRAPHRVLRELLVSLRSEGLVELDTLSMGMSADLEAAVLEGSTLVRVGTAIFGARG